MGFFVYIMDNEANKYYYVVLAKDNPKGLQACQVYKRRFNLRMTQRVFEKAKIPLDEFSDPDKTYITIHSAIFFDARLGMANQCCMELEDVHYEETDIQSWF